MQPALGSIRPFDVPFEVEARDRHDERPQNQSQLGHPGLAFRPVGRWTRGAAEGVFFRETSLVCHRFRLRSFLRRGDRVAVLLDHRVHDFHDT